MPCYRPLVAHKEGLNPNGKANLVFNRKGSQIGPDAFKLPCGKCIGCCLDRARQWSIRLVHEAKFWESSCFITLTYAPDKLPKNGSIEPYDFQCFIKRLRKKLKKKCRTFTAVSMAQNSVGHIIMPLFMVMIFQTGSCGRRSPSPSIPQESYQRYGHTVSQPWAISPRSQRLTWHVIRSKRSTEIRQNDTIRVGTRNT